MDNYDKLLKRVTNLVTKNSISCPNCDNSYLLDPNDSNLKNRNYFFCCLCHHKIIFNEDKESLDKEELEKTLKLANANGWKECPCCHEMIEKSG